MVNRLLMRIFSLDKRAKKTVASRQDDTDGTDSKATGQKKVVNEFEGQLLQLKLLKTSERRLEEYPGWACDMERAARTIQRAWRSRKMRLFKGSVFALLDGNHGQSGGKGSSLVTNGWGYQWDNGVVPPAKQSAKKQSAKKKGKSSKGIRATPPDDSEDEEDSSEEEDEDQQQGSRAVRFIQPARPASRASRQLTSKTEPPQPPSTSLRGRRSVDSGRGSSSPAATAQKAHPKPSRASSERLSPKVVQRHALKAATEKDVRRSLASAGEKTGQRVNQSTSSSVAWTSDEPTAGDSGRRLRPSSRLPARQSSEAITAEMFQFSRDRRHTSAPDPGIVRGRMNLHLITEARDMVLGARNEFYKLKNQYFKPTLGCKYLTSPDAAPSVADFNKWTISMKIKVLALANELNGLGDEKQLNRKVASSAFAKMGRVAATVSSQISAVNWQEALSVFDKFGKAAASNVDLEVKFVDQVEHWLSFLLDHLEQMIREERQSADDCSFLQAPAKDLPMWDPEAADSPKAEKSLSSLPWQDDAQSPGLLKPQGRPVSSHHFVGFLDRGSDQSECATLQRRAAKFYWDDATKTQTDSGMGLASGSSQQRVRTSLDNIIPSRRRARASLDETSSTSSRPQPSGSRGRASLDNSNLGTAARQRMQSIRQQFGAGLVSRAFPSLPAVSHPKSRAHPEMRGGLSPEHSDVGQSFGSALPVRERFAAVPDPKGQATPYRRSA